MRMQGFCFTFVCEFYDDDNISLNKRSCSFLNIFIENTAELVQFLQIHITFFYNMDVLNIYKLCYMSYNTCKLAIYLTPTTYKPTMDFIHFLISCVHIPLSFGLI